MTDRMKAIRYHGPGGIRVEETPVPECGADEVRVKVDACAVCGTDLKAWKVIDDAGMRGARKGGAQMSEKHSNFLINAENATAADLEGLGEEVRKKVYDSSGITLEWEIMRVGDY